MRNNYRHFIIAAIVIGITSIFAGSVHAQWQFVRADHDTAGHLTYFEERTRAGDVRIERILRTVLSSSRTSNTTRRVS
jgi:hypothetical protein